MKHHHIKEKFGMRCICCGRVGGGEAVVQQIKKLPKRSSKTYTFRFGRHRKKSFQT